MSFHLLENAHASSEKTGGVEGLKKFALLGSIGPGRGEARDEQCVLRRREFGSRSCGRERRFCKCEFGKIREVVRRRVRALLVSAPHPIGGSPFVAVGASPLL